jgi:hypothetical protein
MPFHPILEDPVLRLPIKGKTYVVKSPDAATGLFIQSLMSTAQMSRSGLPVAGTVDAQLVLDDDDERNLFQRALGDTYAELSTDGVGWHNIKRAGSAAVLWIHRGEEAAELFWNGGTSDPKAPISEDPESTANEAPPA